MSDKFTLIPIDKLLKIFIAEDKTRNEFLGIHKDLFVNKLSKDISTQIFNQKVEIPLGVAAGPHGQLSQNIISAWLCGARYIELKTIQTLDEIEVAKPCIDMQDEGYNCEWSQELKVKETFDQYLDAWIILHIINHMNGKNSLEGTIFNMSVGYDLAGILKDNVQWFFEKMKNCEAEKNEKIEILRSIYPDIDKINIPNTISDNITLSTMHGCPPDEIEKIASYLIEEKGLHTYVKLNPTLLGPYELRDILNNKCKFDTNVPNEAFGHDLKYDDALKLIKSLQEKANQKGVQFGLKLTNTLESVNHKETFGDEVGMMYMSGKSLHPLSVNVARKLQNEFNGELNISFAGGADAFNFADILACGMHPVTVSSDILKPGGYGRLKQYVDNLLSEFEKNNATSINDLIMKKADDPKNLKEARLENLNRYAKEVLEDEQYKKKGFKEPNIKGTRKLDYFDCIEAPCRENCATHQDIPDYLHFASEDKTLEAFETILKTNPLPAITGNICDHLCQLRCTRINYDEPVLIREIKRYVEENHANEDLKPGTANGKKVAIIGAGPTGLSCAFYLRLKGFEVELFESKDKAGGMVSSAVPSFRLSDEKIARDVDRITALGAKISYNTKVDKALFDKLHSDYDYLYIATGAPLSATLNLPGIEAQGVIEPLEFLFNARLGQKDLIGKNVAIIGGGNTAMDAARVAFRLVGKEGKVTLVYRRSIKEMPADLGEIKAVMEEGVEILELTAPEEVLVTNGKATGLKCSKMELVAEKGARPRPQKIEGSEFTLEFDTIIPAVGQEVMLDFIDAELFKPHPNTFEIRLERVYTGGDVMRGAATAIKAIGDGRRVAERIIAKAGFENTINDKPQKSYEFTELMKKRSLRVKAVNVKETPLSDRVNFNEVTFTLDKESAITEASRCLQCDELCNICVTVCPNRANYYYKIDPVKYQLYKAIKKGDGVELAEDTIFQVKQAYQIINIGDFCNECGNCTTFCPTSRAPYLDKPKFYLDIKAFNEAEEGFMLSKLKNKIILIYKEKGGIRTMEQYDGKWTYETDHVKATFNVSDFKPIDVNLKVPCAQQAHFHMAAEMSVLYNAAVNLYQ
ncbi:MAG: putative selenate reductase subunit YgfK [Salinivirgaceae bacterium]|nr:putative selenate reductase subunit YgfK [Salinivirgaceae bacterium]